MKRKEHYKNRLIYLINEILLDISEDLSINETIVVFKINNKFEDYDIFFYDDEPIISYEDKEFRLMTRKEFLIMLEDELHSKIKHESNVFRCIRLVLDISATEFAKLLDVSRQTVNQIEDGSISPSLKLKNKAIELCTDFVLEDFDNNTKKF